MLFRSFTQVVILGSASFVPFMQLPSSQRREVIEDILDIRIFSTMNQLLKEKALETKNEITRIENEISNAKSKVDAQSVLIKTISDAKAETISALETKITANSDQVTETNGEIQQLIEEIGLLKVSITTKDRVVEDIDKAKAIRAKLNQKVETCEHNAEFFTANDVCPQCSQDIPEDHKSKIIQIGRAHV